MNGRGMARDAIGVISNSRVIGHNQHANKHLDDEEEPIECPDCQTEVYFSELKFHLERECSARLIFCSKCGQDYPVIVYSDHRAVCEGKMRQEESK